VNPENTNVQNNEEKWVRGPNEGLEMHVNMKQNVPKAFAISELERQSLGLNIDDENKRKKNLKEIFSIK